MNCEAKDSLSVYHQTEDEKYKRDKKNDEDDTAVYFIRYKYLATPNPLTIKLEEVLILNVRHFKLTGGISERWTNYTGSYGIQRGWIRIDGHL